MENRMKIIEQAIDILMAEKKYIYCQHCGWIKDKNIEFHMVYPCKIK